MSHFTIEMLSEQCGVSMPNIHTWQRYGLLIPLCDKGGKRYFDYSHLLRTQRIFKWLNHGVSLHDIVKLLRGEDAHLNCQWEMYQEKLLSMLEKSSAEKLRHSLRKMGRELPAGLFIDNILNPLWLWLRENSSTGQMTRRVRFDTLLLEYIAFVLQATRKRLASSLMVIPLNMQDPMIVWLEALRYSREGFLIDILNESITHPDLTLFNADHYLLYSDEPLLPLQQIQIRQWQGAGIALFFSGKGFPTDTMMPDNKTDSDNNGSISLLQN